MKKISFSSKWIKDYSEPSPGFTQGYPTNGKEYSIWLRSHKSTYIWIGFEEKKLQKIFFCSKCKKWLFIGVTVSNISHHIDLHLKKKIT